MQTGFCVFKKFIAEHFECLKIDRMLLVGMRNGTPLSEKQTVGFLNR